MFTKLMLCTAIMAAVISSSNASCISSSLEVRYMAPNHSLKNKIEVMSFKGPSNIYTPQIGNSNDGICLVHIYQYAETGDPSSSSSSSSSGSSCSSSSSSSSDSSCSDDIAVFHDFDKINIILTFKAKHNNPHDFLSMLKTLMPNLNCKGNIGLESSCAEIVLAATKCNEVVYQMYFAPKKYKDVFERFYKAKSAGKTLVPPGNVGTNIVVGDISVLHCDEHTDEINIKDERYSDVRKAIDTVFSCYSDD